MQLDDGPDNEFLGVAQGVLAGTTLYISGQVGVGSSLREQADNAFRGIRKVIEAAGGAMADLVQITIWTCAPADDDDAIATARRSACDGTSFPASTTIRVSSLSPAGSLVQIQGVAIIGPPA